MTITGERTIEAFVENFREIEAVISSERGDFRLFALIERDDAPGRWDVVVSASWAGGEYRDLIETIAKQMRSRLTQAEQLMVSRIVVLPPTDSLVQSLNLIDAEHSSVKLSNNSFNGLLIKEAYIITSKK